MGNIDEEIGKPIEYKDFTTNVTLNFTSIHQIIFRVS